MRAGEKLPSFVTPLPESNDFVKSQASAYVLPNLDTSYPNVVDVRVMMEAFAFTKLYLQLIQVNGRYEIRYNGGAPQDSDAKFPVWIVLHDPTNEQEERIKVLLNLKAEDPA